MIMGLTGCYPSAVNLAVTFLTFLALAAASAWGASLEATVKDAKGVPLEDAVVWARPKGAPLPRVPRDAAVEQINKTFVPLVTIVQTGTPVRFPNRDEIRHHVYSFSPAKVFELKLYAGTPVAPVVFDKPGEVVLGCNIHDHMIGYVFVVDSPFYAKTGKTGAAKIELPAGEYEVHAWHYSQAAYAEARAAKVDGDEAASVAFAVTTRIMPPRPTPK
jgi:plastocyanin